MKSRVQRIEIQNFKAFRQFSLNLEGRHLLLYGPNGSGKSSLYWALYTFLQSAGKQPTGVISKYFQAGGNECLLNTHEQAEVTPRTGKIALTLREDSTNTDTTYRISEIDHGTHNVPTIVKGNLASDFITYRFFFGFSDFKNSQKFDLWPLFEQEILPFCVSTTSQVPVDLWRKVANGNANPCCYSGYAGTDAYANFHQKTLEFATVLEPIVDSISAEAQRFYDQHFAEGDPAPVSLVLRLTQKPSSSGGNQNEFKFNPPVIELGIKVGNSVVNKPQSFLNEAKMTQIALSIRFAASLINLHESDIKLLVLDDLLVSLDMNNRMKVVEIFLSDTFSNYQKIILTHDRGFFGEFKRAINLDHGEWCFRRLQGNPKDGIVEIEDKHPIDKASDYLKGYDLDAAAIQLRKAAEETAKKYRKVAMGELPSTGKFHSLTEDLRAAKNHLLQQLPLTLYNQALEGIPEEHRSKLVSVSDDDIDNDTSLDPATKGKIKCQRKRLKQFLSDQAWKNLEVIETIDAVIQMKDRVLNPAAHWNETPLYEAELKKALRLVSLMETRLRQAVS
jgi:energy-coupling factor transporter ATP-binding protein EcfA2